MSVPKKINFSSFKEFNRDAEVGSILNHLLLSKFQMCWNLAKICSSTAQPSETNKG